MSEWYNCPKCGTERENLCACLNSKCEDFNGDDDAAFIAAVEATNSPTAKRIAELERENAALRKELAEVTAAFQAECDHEFVTEDHSFSHEFGTEKIFVCRCEKCGKDAEPDDVPGRDEDGCDDGPRDAREEARNDP